MESCILLMKRLAMGLAMNHANILRFPGLLLSCLASTCMTVTINNTNLIPYGFHYLQHEFHAIN
jgi:hypothetical protein